MQVLNLHIKVNKNKVQIEFSPSTSSTTYLNTTLKQLDKLYKAKVEDLSLTLVRQMIKDNKINKYTISNFDSKVITRTNNKKTYKFQIEDSLVHITEIATQKEIFCPLNYISNFNTFSVQDFEEVILKKKRITPVRSNIETGELTFELFSED